MAKISNLDEFESLINKNIIRAMQLTKDKIFEVLSDKVSDYYEEEVFGDPEPSIPNVYERTGKLMESLTASNIMQSGNQFYFTVGFDDDYLTFKYPSGYVTKKYGSRYNGISGEQVLQAFNSKTHGFIVSGSHRYWDEALKELGGQEGILNLFKENCKKVGIPIK